MTKTKDYWVDGHLLFAESVTAVRRECLRLYDHDPEVIRLWTEEDGFEDE